MLAYSSIAHAGYILAGLAAGSAAGYGGALFYLLAYTVMNIGAFGVIAALEWDGEQGADQTLDSLSGAGYRKPVLGVAMGVFMFALAGFPPSRGLYRQVPGVLGAAVQSRDLTWLAIVGVIASMISGVLLSPRARGHVDEGALRTRRQRPRAQQRGARQDERRLRFVVTVRRGCS